MNVIMITGDNLETGMEVGGRCGIVDKECQMVKIELENGSLSFEQEG